MKELRLKLRFLTPAFIGGPDGSSAELRPPSVKGMLRFWWRAVNAGNFRLNELKLNEARIFGDASGNGRVSSFLIQVKSGNLNNNLSKESFPNPA
ncbi:MAG: type III-B CRISPR module RAMP protein Cmr1 [Peptococcaceae bacterium]|nr:type III-B CRISPR module RAMP protein Cmr1 [Peptococcaceae bacterium]